jgi:hypothetical protein
LKPDIKLYYIATVIKTAWYCHKNRHKNQCKRIEDKDTIPCSYSHLIFNKGLQNVYWRKETLFNKRCWENWRSTCRKPKLDPRPHFISVLIQIGPRILMQDLKLWKNRNSLKHIGISTNFLNRNSIAQQLREKINKWECIKLTSLDTGNSRKTEEATYTLGEKFCKVYIWKVINSQNI